MNKVPRHKLSRQKTVSWLLRLGLAVVFLYAAIDSFLHPNDWVGYLPHFLDNFMALENWLKVFSIYELLLAAWLLSGVYIRYGAILCGVTLIGIIVFNLSLLAITFRDIALIFAAAALAVLED